MKALMLGVLLAATAVVGAGVETAWAQSGRRGESDGEARGW